MKEPEIMLLTGDLSELIQVPVSTIVGWRSTGEGPNFAVLPGVDGELILYSASEVKAWLASINAFPLPPFTWRPTGKGAPRRKAGEQ